MKIANVVGARPNFVKIAPILDAMRGIIEIDAKLVHTGQHYDYEMNQAFFEDLTIADADVSLGVGDGSHAEQTARIMVAFEDYCLENKPDLVLVVGDVNSTVACSLAAKKLNIPVAHVEAGLRSGDMAMPEEINRRCTDAITDIFFASEPSGVANLRREGVAAERIHFVGNVMIDTLFKHQANAAALEIPKRFGVVSRNYAVATLHRPSNTDDPNVLRKHLEALLKVSERLQVIFPMHPRTKAAVERYGLGSLIDGSCPASIQVVEPMRYLEFIGILQEARLAITDSGGLQEETTALGVPCLTMRDNTERPITCERGTNRLVGPNAVRLREIADAVLDAPWPEKPVIQNWDGHAAERIVERLTEWDQREFDCFEPADREGRQRVVVGREASRL